MRRFDPGSSLAVCALAGLVWTAVSPKLAAEQGALAPDFFSNDAAWILADRNGDYIPIPGGPSPTREKPKSFKAR